MWGKGWRAPWWTANRAAAAVGRKCGWRRTAHHYAHPRSATRTPREPAVRCSRGLLQWTRTPLGHRWPRRAIPKRSGRRLHPRSQPAHSSCRAGPSEPATRRLSGCTQHIGTRRPACTDSASYVSSACLLSGTGSRFGTSGTCMSGLPPAGPVPPARVENNDILCVFPTNETRHKR